MAVAESLGVDPISAVVQELQEALCVRAQPLAWRTTTEGLVAAIAEGELVLAPCIEGAAWQLSVVFHAAPNPDDPGAMPVERGRRMIAWGAPAQVQQRALELAMRGVPGGPAYLGGPLVWHAIEHDGSLRMAVSSGELRISPLEGELCTLSHEDGGAVEFLTLGTREELQRQAFPLCLMRAGRLLRIRVKGRLVNLRSIGVPGVLGYHELADRSLAVLALIHGDLLLLQVRGTFHRILSQLSWEDLMFGEPVVVQPSRRIESRPAQRSTRSGHRGVDADDDDPPSALEPVGGTSAARSWAAGGNRAANSGPRVETGVGDASPIFQGVAQVIAADPPDRSAPTAHTPMNDRHRELCRRYFRRLCRRLHGRGARKARRLVLLILEALESCREDITGSRLEVHARLERLLAQRLAGGPRNIRDCLDLLMCSSPFARPEPGKGCTLLFSQLHDPGSELMRFIADDDAREAQAANGPVVTPESYDAPHAMEAQPELPSVQQDPSAAEDAGRPNEPTPEPEPPPIPPAPATAPAPCLSPPPSVSWEHATVEVFRQLGRPLPAAFSNLEQRVKPPQTPDPPAAPPQPAQPGISQSRSTSPSPAALRGFTSTKTWFLGELVDDDDETDAPSRYQGRSSHEEPPDSGAPSDLSWKTK